MLQYKKKCGEVEQQLLEKSTELEQQRLTASAWSDSIVIWGLEGSPPSQVGRGSGFTIPCGMRARIQAQPGTSSPISLAHGTSLPAPRASWT